MSIPAITQIPACYQSSKICRVQTRRHDVQSSTTSAAISFLLQHIGQHQPVCSVRSLSSVLQTVPLTKTVTAARAFCISAPTVWNRLPSTVRQTSSQPQFCTHWRAIFLNTSLVDHGYPHRRNHRLEVRGKRQPILEVWELCPQWGPGATPLVRGLVGLCPPEADEFSANETKNVKWN